MYSTITKLPLWAKTSAVLVILIGAGITWWLASPLFLPGQELQEDTLEGELTILSTGEFNFIDSRHFGEGSVDLVENEDGRFYIVFNDVTIANGPQLVVYLSDKNSFSGTGDSAGNYVDLGPLPATQGNFNMEIPIGTNLDEVNSVLIWCEPFSVVFTWATLS